LTLTPGSGRIESIGLRGPHLPPSADDDSKAAEVLSDVLLLAGDSEIKDPTILAQLRSA
jgi:hypothetical protein